jgi:hypothetical protein
MKRQSTIHSQPQEKLEVCSQLYTQNNSSVWKGGYYALTGASHTQSNKDLPKDYKNIYKIHQKNKMNAILAQ